MAGWHHWLDGHELMNSGGDGQEAQCALIHGVAKSGPVTPAELGFEAD